MARAMGKGIWWGRVPKSTLSVAPAMVLGSLTVGMARTDAICPALSVAVTSRTATISSARSVRARESRSSLEDSIMSNDQRYRLRAETLVQQSNPNYWELADPLYEHGVSMTNATFDAILESIPEGETDHSRCHESAGCKGGSAYGGICRASEGETVLTPTLEWALNGVRDVLLESEYGAARWRDLQTALADALDAHFFPPKSQTHRIEILGEPWTGQTTAQAPEHQREIVCQLTKEQELAIHTAAAQCRIHSFDSIADDLEAAFFPPQQTREERMEALLREVHDDPDSDIGGAMRDRIREVLASSE